MHKSHLHHNRIHIPPLAYRLVSPFPSIPLISLLEDALKLQLQLISEAHILRRSRRSGGGGRGAVGDLVVGIDSGMVFLLLMLEAGLDVGGAAAPHVPVLLGGGPRRLLWDHLPVGPRLRGLACVDDVAASWLLC